MTKKCTRILFFSLSRGCNCNYPRKWIILTKKFLERSIFIAILKREGERIIFNNTGRNRSIPIIGEEQISQI